MRKLLCLILAVCSFFMAACQKTEEGNTSGTKGTGDFTLAMRTPESLDPLRANQESGVLVFDLVYDSLVYVDREMRPVPYLAESCTISSDGLTISFTLPLVKEPTAAGA